MKYNRVGRFGLVLVVTVLVGLVVTSGACIAQPAMNHGATVSAAPFAQVDLNPVPGPWESVEKIIRKGIKDIQEAVDEMVTDFNWLLFTVPAPGEPLQPATWADYPWEGDGMTNFTAKWWNSVWRMYWGLTGVASISLSALAVYHHTNRSTITGDPIYNQEKTQQAVRALLLTVVGWVALAMYLHGMNILAVGVAPDNFTSSFGDFGKLGLGVIVGGIILSLESTVILFAVLVLVAQWLLIVFAFATFPVAMVARVSGSNYAQVVSDTIISLLVGLPMLKFVQVLLLRFAYGLPTPLGPSSLLTIAVMTIGIFLAFIYLPIKGTERLLPEAMIATGGALRSKGMDGAGTTDSQKAAAVSAQASKVENKVRTGPDSASRRVSPSRSGRRLSQRSNLNGGNGGTSSTTNSNPVRSNPSVTVNTSVNSQNTAQAEAEASATSKSERTSMTTGRNGRIRHTPRYGPYHLLRQAKKRIEQRRRNKGNNDD